MMDKAHEYAYAITKISSFACCWVQNMLTNIKDTHNTHLQFNDIRE